MNEGTLAAKGTARWIAVLALVVGAIALVWEQQAIRDLEAWVSALVLRVGQIFPARTIGAAVVFPLRGAFVGYSISASCTAALLISPFFVLAAGLVASRRVSVRRGIATVAVLAVILFVVNQARILVVALSMRWLGFERGYEVSHVLLGSVVSTLGVLVGLFVFARTIVGGRLLGRTGG